VEYRTRATRIIGQRFHIYASRGRAVWGTDHSSGRETARRIWSDDLAVPGRTHPRGEIPPWLIELAEALILDKLPRGVIVGSAVIEKCVRSSRMTNGPAPMTLFEWHLAGVERATRLEKPSGHPQPVWFKPF